MDKPAEPTIVVEPKKEKKDPKTKRTKKKKPETSGIRISHETVEVRFN